MNERASKTAVITGAASGLGKDIAAALATKGYTVYGTMRPGEKPDLAVPENDGSILLTPLDITDAEGVQTWADRVAEQTGGEVDLLINNAGILTPGPLEALPLDAIRQEFEVNTFAPLTVTNAFLPQLRAARGRIVQISTISAAFPMAFNAPSAASKIAVEALMIAYRTELHPFGVDVTIIQPGSMLTGGPAKTAALLERTADAFTATERGLYGEAFASFTARLNGGQAQGISSASAAAEVVKIAEQHPAPSTATIGDDAAQLAALVRASSPEELDAIRLTLL